jgi:hypothetical protein
MSNKKTVGIEELRNLGIQGFDCGLQISDCGLRI